jgi:hypothetical protein
MTKTRFFRAVSWQIKALGRFCLIETPLSLARGFADPARLRAFASGYDYLNDP